MKKKVVLFVLLFLFCGFCFKPSIFSSAKSIENKGYVYEVSASGRVFSFKEKDLLKNIRLSKKQKEIKQNRNLKEHIKKLSKMGFSKKEIVRYLFPETTMIEEYLSKNFNKKEKEDEIKVYKNECRIKIFEGEEGEFFNSQKFYEDFYEKILKEEKTIKIKAEIKKFKTSNINKEDFVERAEFKTNFKSSSTERKNNIRLALEKFDGVVLDEGEVLSFNAVTGERNEKNGYKQAKIISGGTFVSGFGGGVCQVSTTIYNACLLAGLEILEVHNHSLPVSYIEPCFDAMVNSGSSDLVVRNNTGGKVIITTSCLKDECRVKIFGKQGSLKIKRISEKIKTIPATIERVETDYKRFGLEKLNIGEEKRISYAKDGFYSKGYLEFYDNNGKKVKTEKIRECKYNPTEGVVVKREK